MEQKTKIIIADDMEINREILNEMFYETYEVLQARDGKEVIELLKREKYEIGVLLLDVYMPNMGGFDVLNYMEQKGILDKIPVIVVTVSNAEETTLRAYEYKVAEIVIKPFSAKIVQRRVHNIVEFYHDKQMLERYIMEEMEKQKPPYQALLTYNQELSQKIEQIRDLCADKDALSTQELRKVIE